MKNLTLTLCLLCAAPAFATVGDTSLGRATTTNVNGTQTAFPFFYPIASKADIVVTVTLGTAGVAVVSMNADQIANPGGTVTFSTAPTAGATVKIERTQQLTQTLSISPYYPFPARAVELNFDRITEQLQQVKRDLNDAVIAAGGGGSTFSLTMPGDFSVSGSPGTSITVSRNTQNAHKFLGAPTTNGTPTYRLLDTSDFPASGVTATTYGDTTHVPILTVNASGVLTGASTSSTTLAGINLTNTFTVHNTFSDGITIAVASSGTAVYAVSPDGDGAYFGGGTDGNGMRVYGAGGGDGIEVTAGSGGVALVATSIGNKAAVRGIGGAGASAYGGWFSGGSSSAPGVYVTGGTSNGHALVASGTGSGDGAVLTGGATDGSIGAWAISGATNGIGLKATGSGTGADIAANNYDTVSATGATFGLHNATSYTFTPPLKATSAKNKGQCTSGGSCISVLILTGTYCTCTNNDNAAACKAHLDDATHYTFTSGTDVVNYLCL